MIFLQLAGFFQLFPKYVCLAFSELDFRSGCMFSLIVFVIWNTRSAISPVINKTRDMEERERLALKALREYALKDPRMSEVLKSFNGNYQRREGKKCTEN